MKILKNIREWTFPIAIMAILGTSIFHFQRDVGKQTLEMKSLMQNSPRKEHIVKKGESLNFLRDKFFPVGEDEFEAFENSYFAYNANGHFGGYKGLMADNLWTSIVREENDLPIKDVFFKGYYSINTGDTIYVPVRIWEKNDK